MVHYIFICVPKPKRSILLSLPPRGRGETLSAWLYRELRQAILEGRLKAGAPLPSSRSLSTQYKVARGTVVFVFEQLTSEGYLEGKTGSGTRVSSKLPDEYFIGAGKSSRPALPLRKGHLSQRGHALAQSPFLKLQRSVKALRAFRANQPSVTHFPTEIWSRIGSRRMRMASRSMLLDGDVLGYLPLREAVASHLGETRAVVCDSSQIMIVSGTQQALDLIIRLTLDPGDEAWMEDPGYPGASAMLLAAGASVVSISVDHQGMRVSEGLRKAPQAKLAYVTPAHQFPLGVAMPLERRLQLLEWSRQSGSWIFEDDYDSEFRFAGKPLASLQSLAPYGNVIFSGSFSKMLFPSLRMGFLVLPQHLAEAARQARSLLDRFGPPVEQAVLCDFITEGHFGRHLRKMREIYAEHLAILSESAQKEWGGRLVLQPTDTGLQTVAWLSSSGQSDRDFSRTAAGRGVEVVPLSAFARQWKKRNGLQIGFASISPAEIRRGVEAMGQIL